MAQSKRKVSVTLDEDLVERIGGSENLSAVVNRALRDATEAQIRRQKLSRLLDELEVEDGPVDEELVKRFITALQ